MKAWFGRVLLGLVGSVAVAAVVIYFFFPQALLGLVRWRYVSASGVKEKSVVIDGYNAPYYDGGKGDPVVLIHGFGDNKISFVQAAQWLTPRYRVILPEVPGFGETEQASKRSYSIRAQVEFFHKFFKKLGLQRFVLGGNSMGGHIAAAYALRYPKQVKKLILLNAAGMKTKDMKVPYKPMTKPVANREDFLAYMKKLFYKIPHIPGPYEAYMIKKMGKSFKWLNRLRWDIRNGKDYLLNERAKDIKVPTLILWGDSDRIVPLSVGSAYRKALTTDTWVLMKRCGHIPQYERPQETAEIILNFLQQNTPTSLPTPRSR